MKDEVGRQTEKDLANDTVEPRPTAASLRRQVLDQRGVQLPIEPVTAFGLKLFVRGMTGAERDGFEGAYLEAKESKRAPNIRGALAVRTLCDADGQRLFEDADADQVAGLPARELDRIFAVAQRLSGISQEDVEELEKNSEAPGPGAGPRTTDGAASCSS